MSVIGCENESARSDRSSRHASSIRHASYHKHVANQSNLSAQLSRTRQITNCQRYRLPSDRVFAKSDGLNSGDELLEKRDEVINIDRDDNWGDNTTCVTGNTSDQSCSYDDLRSARFGFGGASSFKQEAVGGEKSLASLVVSRSRCAHHVGLALAAFVCLLAFLSPVVMIIMPKTPFVATLFLGAGATWTTRACNPDCEGRLLSFALKQFLLVAGIWVLFFRNRDRAHLPRVRLSRASLLALVFVVTFAFWLFYGVRILSNRLEDFSAIVAFALSLTDALLFIHYVCVILLEIFPLRPAFRIRVLRSPDGVAEHYTIGALSIQCAALYVLERYHRDFSVYNPHADRVPASSAFRIRGAAPVAAAPHNNRRHRAPSSVVSAPPMRGGNDSDDAGATQPQQFKVYDIDGGQQQQQNQLANLVDSINPQVIMAAAARKRDMGHNDRFYYEAELERKIKRRRARLLTAAEEAFAHVRRLNEEKGPCMPMDADETAQAVFPSFARALSKFLRATRQQPRHTAEQVLRHLSQMLTFDMSARAFLERFFSSRETHEASQSPAQWSIVCADRVSRTVAHGMVFQLRCQTPGPHAGVLLFVQATKLPLIDLTEEPPLNPKQNKFVLRLNSETSV